MTTYMYVTIHSVSVSVMDILRSGRTELILFASFFDRGLVQISSFCFDVQQMSHGMAGRQPHLQCHPLITVFFSMDVNHGIVLEQGKPRSIQTNARHVKILGSVAPVSDRSVTHFRMQK